MKNIWTNGCFDILHRGHIEMFKYAKSLGDRLIVGVDSDERVRKSKGNTRPINCVEDRVALLEAIEYIDNIFVFDSSEELERLVNILDIDTMVVGSDWQGKPIVGETYAKKVLFFHRVGDYSTTNILKEIKKDEII